jgi:plastocyanin
MRSKTLLVALALVALLGACGGDSDDGGDTGGGSSAGDAATLTASGFKFDPTSLSVAAGGSIEYTNEDDTEHNFTVEEADIDEDVDPSGSTTIDLGDVEAGSYDFFCEYHKDQMTGTLEVTG